MKTPPSKKSEYRHWLSIPTRWNDNDQYGHVNNAVYYFYFDTLVNNYLIENGLLNLDEASAVDDKTDLGLVVETGCQYFASFAYPDTILAGLKISKIGSSSVRYEIGLFAEGASDKDSALVQGHFVHVYVDPDSRRPKKLNEETRQILEKLLVQ